MSYAPELIVRDEVASHLSADDSAWLQTLLNRLYDVLGCPVESEATVVITDDQEIQSLNREWRNIDEPTDVLSFAYQEASDGFLLPELLGDVVISLPTATRYAQDAQHAERVTKGQATAQPWSIQLELAFLLAHGFLHLLGFDHEEAEEEREMRAAEQVIFEALIDPQPPQRRETMLRPSDF